jgi:aminopeptidase N
MSVTAPNDWKVIFTTLESDKKTAGSKTLWNFPASPIMSTYLFSIHAGDYEVWNDRYKNIPLRVFVRASLKKYVDVAFWFSTTKKGFRFFEKEFAYDYPFKKYDQLIVPEFSSGGMENIAAVNYSERFVPRGTPSREERENLSNVMLHELAHMWFGDLVTMNWWDELWLNESFATFMAYNASEKATEFKEAWTRRRVSYTARLVHLGGVQYPYRGYGGHSRLY